MDEHARTDTPDTPFDARQTEIIEETSTEYLGRWNRLISTTNWEKGRIISQWREALETAEAPDGSYTDEAWSRWVGNVSPQHAGRLRRVFQRFGETNEQYAGLYWSHFQAALDWNDAEMWLEGAVQNGWSISQMRHQRWEAMGAPDEKKPRSEDIISVELDEDVDPDVDDSAAETISGTLGQVRDAEDESDSTAAMEEAHPSAEPFRPFENVPTLPSDLNEAFEGFKLAILHHRLSGWQEVSCDDVLAALDSLKALALAKAES